VEKWGAYDRPVGERPGALEHPDAEFSSLAVSPFMWIGQQGLCPGV
jgi:hypothetical protein